MKARFKFHHWFVLLLIGSGIVVLQSCVVYNYPPPALVKVPDIIKMSKDGLTSKDIIQKIKDSHTAYSLPADQLAKLQKQGVSDSVINYMEQTHFRALMHNSQPNYSYYGWPGWYGYNYGWPYYGLSSFYLGYNWGSSGYYYRGGGYYGGHRGGRYR